MADNSSFEYSPLSEEEHRLLRKIYTRESCSVSWTDHACKVCGDLSLTPCIDILCHEGGKPTLRPTLLLEDTQEYVRVGPVGCVLSSTFLKHAAGIKNMPLRDTDTFVVSFPRSGTTWTQELVWLLANNLDFETAKSIPLTERYPFLEIYMVFLAIANNFKEDVKKDADKKKIFEGYIKTAAEVLADTPSPRFIKSHLPLSLLPASTLDTAKVVYVARDPRDVVVSCYHFFKTHESRGLEGTLKEFYELFTKNLVIWTPYFEHVKEAWAQRNHPNMLFLFYEDLVKDLEGSAKKVSDFLGKQYSEEQLDQLCDFLSFDNFQKNSAVDMKDLRKLGALKGNETTFIRKGKAGGWRESFDEEMKQHAERWMADNLRDTDLRFHS